MKSERDLFMARWEYGDQCAFCHAGNHRACLGTRWRVSNDTSTARKYYGDEEALTGGPCGCAQRGHA